MKLHLHIGAHKTASTHLQHLLRNNVSRLQARSVACFGPQLLRTRMKLPQLGADHPAGQRLTAPLVLALQQAQSRGQRLVISEENILGTTRANIIACGHRLYPNADRRVTRFLTLVGARDVTLYLAVRNPPDFVNSAYGQQIKGGKLINFESYIAGFDPLALRWSELVARLVACPAVGRLVLWRYEDYGQVLPDILAHLLGPDAASGMRLSSAPRQVGSSARAIAHARARLRADPTLSRRTAIAEAEAQFPKSAQWPGPQHFTPDVLAEGMQTYQDDLIALQSRDKVVFVHPHPCAESGQ
ncbi:hypothetical protein [Roseinatronobacter sp. S2]|uniref:hypothetical protein n=1 Tax=Roseinatronobacter sp. S2 TaxID=3035471 RepID=UPI00240F40BC|nr:hypothetical protein [Roseinatronobacter sp. S2]WFE73627.1 hypothetical protein P8S53_10550 [Roseinatronobacter sp. S2]